MRWCLILWLSLTWAGWAQAPPGVPSDPLGPRHFGVVFNPDRKGDTQDLTQALARLEELGVGWARVHLSWRRVEPQPGALDEAELRVCDEVIGRLKAAGIEVMGFVGGVGPEWAQEGQSPRVHAEAGSKRQVRAEKRRPPANPEDLARFVAAMADRYRGRVSVWQVMNEINAEGRWTEPEHLARIFQALRAQVPGCVLVMPGLAGAAKKKPLRYLEEFLEAGGGRHVDVIDVHMYQGFSKMYTVLPEVRRLMDRSRLALPLQISETGSPSRFGPRSTAEGREWLAQQIRRGEYDERLDALEATPQSQAEELVKRLVVALSLGVHRVYWCRFSADEPEDGIPIDNESDYGADGSKGLLDYGYRPKPAYWAFKILIGKLDTAVFEKRLEVGPGAEGYLFRARGGSVAVLWAGQAPVTVEPSFTGRDLRVYDLFGKMLPAKDGLRLSSAPIYLEWKP